MWNSTSSSLYKQILNEGMITLPSTRTLYRLSFAITFGTGFTDSALKYIKLRMENLNQFERKMSILIGEVYTSKACEFVNGQFRGIELGTDNPTKTLLSIMASTVTSKFSEIVEMIPVVKLDSALLKTMFFPIVQQLTPMDIDPVCCIVDGHSSYRKFYQHEGNGITRFCYGRCCQQHDLSLFGRHIYARSINQSIPVNLLCRI